MEERMNYLLRELANLNYCQGRHSGIWDSVDDRETFAFRYLEKMMEYAREHDVPFKEEISENFDEDTWKYHQNDLSYAYDELGYDLKECVQDKIIEEITLLKKNMG